MLSQTSGGVWGAQRRVWLILPVMVSEKFTGEDRVKVNLWEGFQILV